MKYNVGDKVIISERGASTGPWAEDMNSWSGAVMTIKEARGSHYVMIEDEGCGPKEQDRHWHWYEGMIKCLAEDEIDFEPSTADELRKLYESII